MNDPVGNFVRKLARIPGDILAKTKITPNQITLAGLLVNCAVAFIIAKGQLSFFIIGLLIWLAGFIDALDGRVARVTGCTTVFGNFFDSVLDRYADSVIYLGILIYYLKSGRSDYVILIVITMMGSLIVSYTRAKAESLGQKADVGLMPRAVRIIILGASFCVGQVFPGLLVIAVLSHFTGIQRIYYVYKQLQK